MRRNGQISEKTFLYFGFSILFLIFGIVLVIFFLFNQNPLVVRSLYRGYEAGYDSVFLKSEIFCSTKMRSTTDVQISSALMHDTSKYTYDTETGLVNTKGIEYLNIGKYNIDVSLKNSTKNIVLSVYDTQPPIFLSPEKTFTVPAGLTSEELAGYFPVRDYDPQKSLVIFAVDPDLTKPQKSDLALLCYDTSGNYSLRNITLEVKEQKKGIKFSKQYDDRAGYITIQTRSEMESLEDQLDAKRKKMIDTETKLAESMDTEIPNFTKYDYENKQIQNNIDAGMTINEAHEKAEEEAEKKEEKEEKKKESKNKTGKDKEKEAEKKAEEKAKKEAEKKKKEKKETSNKASQNSQQEQVSQSNQPTQNKPIKNNSNQTSQTKKPAGTTSNKQEGYKIKVNWKQTGHLFTYKNDPYIYDYPNYKTYNSTVDLIQSVTVNGKVVNVQKKEIGKGKVRITYKGMHFDASVTVKHYTSLPKLRWSATKLGILRSHYAPLKSCTDSSQCSGFNNIAMNAICRATERPSNPVMTDPFGNKLTFDGSHILINCELPLYKEIASGNFYGQMQVECVNGQSGQFWSKWGSNLKEAYKTDIKMVHYYFTN